MKPLQQKQVVLPGQDVTDIIQEVLEGEEIKYVVGPGIVREGKRTKALTAGTLQMKDKPLVFWVHSHQRKVRLINYSSYLIKS